MKKLVSLLLAALLLLGVTAAFAESYPMNQDVLGTEQGPVWFYRYYTAETDEIKDLNFYPEWGDNWQFSTQPEVDGIYSSLFEWDGVHTQPGKWLGFNVDIVLVFVAPKDGKATIEPINFVHKDDGNEWPPYLVQIQHVSGENEPVNLLGEEVDFVETPFQTEAIELELKAGDEIRFISRATDNGGATVYMEPTVTYAE